jgi:glutamyl-tRNA synthetase/nondiscriminating glutamyl-tRNA synthetase
VGRLTALGAWFLSKAGYIEIKDGKWLSAQSTPEVKLEPDIESWLARVVELVAPSVDRLDQLPERAALIFTYDAKAAMVAPDNAEVLAWPNTDAVLTRFTVKILEDESAKAGKLTPECFKLLVNEVKAETGAKGKELFHPIRIVITGSHSGPEFDKLIPILEDGSRLKLPKHVLSVRERVEDFGRARAHKS